MLKVAGTGATLFRNNGIAPSLIKLPLTRCLSTSGVLSAYNYEPEPEPHKKITKVHHVNEFKHPNRMGTKKFKKEQNNRYKPKYPDIPIHRYGVKYNSILHPAKFEPVKEMTAEIIVPDLEGCKLKPYVSYATKDIYQDELTSQDLFNVIYGPKIVKDFKEGKLDDDGNPLEPTEIEKMTSEEAYIKARQTGSDIFQGGEPTNPLWNLDIPVGKN